MLAGLLFASAGAGGAAQQDPTEPKDPGRLPDGRMRSEALLKADFEDNQKDIAKMKKLLEGVEDEMKKYDRHVLSIKSIKDREEVEKISRRVRGRMSRF